MYRRPSAITSLMRFLCINIVLDEASISSHVLSEDIRRHRTINKNRLRRQYFHHSIKSMDKNSAILSIKQNSRCTNAYCTVSFNTFKGKVK